MIDSRPKAMRMRGLKWRMRGGKWEGRWRARADLVRLGYPTKSVVLWSGLQPSDAEIIALREQCERLQRQMLEWSRNPIGMSQKLGYIYFITDDVAVKIGYSVDVPRRLIELQQPHYLTLRVIAQFVGTPADESALHERFKDLVIQREWFKMSPRIEEMIARLEASRGLLHSRAATIRDIEIGTLI